MALPPDAVLVLLVADASGHAKPGLLSKGPHELLEVVRLHRDVRVKLHHNVRQRFHRRDASVEGSNDGCAARRDSSGRVHEADPLVPGVEGLND